MSDLYQQYNYLSALCARFIEMHVWNVFGTVACHVYHSYKCRCVLFQSPLLHGSCTMDANIKRNGSIQRVRKICTLL